MDISYFYLLNYIIICLFAHFPLHAIVFVYYAMRLDTGILYSLLNCELLGSPPVFGGVHAAHLLSFFCVVFFCVFCLSSSCCLCLWIVDLFITPYVFSNNAIKVDSHESVVKARV
jgi:hypothetical protein